MIDDVLYLLTVEVWYSKATYQTIIDTLFQCLSSTVNHNSSRTVITSHSSLLTAVLKIPPKITLLCFFVIKNVIHKTDCFCVQKYLIVTGQLLMIIAYWWTVFACYLLSCYHHFNDSFLISVLLLFLLCRLIVLHLSIQLLHCITASVFY